MQAHELANLFPMMTAGEHAELLKDMRDNGYDQTAPIVIYEGKILDGRNRWKAAQELGIKPVTVQYDGKDPLGFVIRHNLTRRHLNESQRAVVAGRLANMRHGGDRKNQVANLPLDNQRYTCPYCNQDYYGKGGHICKQVPVYISQSQAAEMLNVSDRTIRTVKAVERQAPELIQEIEKGNLNAHQAQQIAKLPEPQRAVVLPRVVSGKSVSTAVREAKKEEEEERTAAIVVPANTTERYKIYHCGVAELMNHVAPNSIDWIITDPPYPREFLETYAELAKFAKYALKDGGSLLAMAGQSYLPDIYAMLGAELTYHWTLAYTTAGGQSPQIWPRKVNTFWKPVLWYTKGAYQGDWIGDVAKSNVNDNDKNYHHWGQSESGFYNLCEKFVKRGDTVCDPFLGGGTTAVIALELGTFFVGCDINQSEVDKTLRRIQDGS
jgi:16S rRNA G966 N2-methylase RsmD